MEHFVTELKNNKRFKKDDYTTALKEVFVEIDDIMRDEANL